MQQVWITRHGDVDVLEVREGPDPRPAAGEALVAVHAIGVNFADIMARMGLYLEAPRGPFVPGYEVSGTVIEAGRGVPFQLGDRVMGITRFGGYSTLVAVPHAQLWPMPRSMSFPEAAALPVSYLTASLAVRRFGRLESGEWMLIRSAAGALGLAAVQLARAAGGRVAGSSSPAKHERLREMGVEITLPPRTDLGPAVRAALDRGVDLIVNSTGGPTVRADLGLLEPLGRIVLCGISTAAPGRRRSLGALLGLLAGTPRPHPFSLMNRNQGIFGINLGRLWSEIDRLRQELSHVIDLYETGAVRPVISRVFPFHDAARAHAHLQDRSNVGKAVLEVDQPS